MGADMPPDDFFAGDESNVISLRRLPPGGDSVRPSITLGTDIAREVDAGIAALSAHDDGIYQRAGELVHVTGATREESERERAPLQFGSPVIRPMGAATLLERMTSSANWQKFDGRSKGPRSCTPPKHTVAALHARAQWRGIRSIVGVITTPSMRPDGTVLQAPGYDPVTGYLYAPSRDYPPIADAPTLDDARAALLRLLHVWCDFPFVDGPARLVPIAALCTLLARPAIRGSVPCFAIDAPTRGTGKGLAATVACVIATGAEPALTTWPSGFGGQDELEKMLGGYAVAGASCVFFDNVPIGAKFGGAPLEKVLTAPDVVSLRVLGRSEVPTLPWRAVVIAAGNNLTVADETARRVLLGRMVSDLDHPEERTGFVHTDLLAFARENRASLVTDALTILRAYTAAGSQDTGQLLLGSYEAWSRLVPRALFAAGGVDVLGARVVLAGDTDGDGGTHADILAGLARLTKDAPLTARAILDALYPAPRHDEPPDGYEGLRDAIEAACRCKSGQKPTSGSLGCYLRGVRERKLGGRALRASRRDNSTEWGVR